MRGGEANTGEAGEVACRCGKEGRREHGLGEQRSSIELFLLTSLRTDGDSHCQVLMRFIHSQPQETGLAKDQ